MREETQVSPCNRWVRIGLIGLGVVLFAIVIAAYGIYHASEARLTRQYDTGPVPSLAGGDSARGAHLVNAVSLCSRCHAADLGGQVMADNPVMRVAAPNLTRGAGGRSASWTEADWNRAIRHGIGGRGNPLLVMPADAYAGMSDEDLRAVVAYLRTIKPVDRHVLPAKVKAAGRAIMVATDFNEIAAERIRHERRAPEFASLDDGTYLTRIAGCTYCHQGDFGGRRKPVGPPGAPLPPRINNLAQRGWTLDDFSNAVRRGVRPDGSAINRFMPWSSYAGMTDQEIAALWLTTQNKDNHVQQSCAAPGCAPAPGGS